MPRCFWLCCLLLALGSSTIHADTNWPRWRGPLENGHTSDTKLPVKWGDDAIVWQVPLPGSGQSSPVIWGDRVFLTTALDQGKQRVVFCLDRRTGKPLWQQTAWTGEPEKVHIMNGWASSTCSTDGERVYAFFGLGGLHCYSALGKPLWSRDLGQFKSPWGVSSCPVLAGDVVIQNCDSDENAYITGLDKRTGKTIWSTLRPDHRGWSTPIVIDVDGHQEAVINGHAGVTAYDPQSGRELWFCKSFSGRGEPTVTPAGKVLCVVNGQGGDIYAIKPGGSGDVTETHMAWHTRRKGARDCPSPIVIGDYMLVMDMKGIVTCYRPSTGEELWKQRIGGNFSASPIAANGLAFFIGEDGTTVVLRPGDKAEVIAENPLTHASGEIFRATLTPCAGQWFIRSTNKLYCIGAK